MAVDSTPKSVQVTNLAQSCLRRRLLIASLITVVVLAVLASYLVWSFIQAAEDFQKDADVFRLQHLKHYGDLIEEYHAQTGKYPFEGTAEVPVYVHIANNEQAKYASNGPPTPHKLISMHDFIAELEQGLGRTVKERYDPSLAPRNKPNFYIYMVNKDYYFFAVHVHQPYPFAKKVAENYYKAEISSTANDKNQATSPKQLFESPEFQTAIQKGVSKPGFFAEREKQYEASSKEK